MFDFLLQTLSVLKPLLGDSIILFSIAVGVAFALIALTIMYLVGTAVDPVKRRLVTGDTTDHLQAPSAAKKLDRAFTPVKGLILPKNISELGEVRKRMVYAGYRGGESITAFYAVKILLVLGLGILGGLIAFPFAESGSYTVVSSICIGAFAGMILPSYYLDKQVAKRQLEIINGFPDVLDLLVACSEAGLGLNAAIQRVARETKTIYPTLSAELELVNSEIRAGVDRVEALHGLSERTGVEEIGGFVSMVSQSVKFGTGIAETLRIYAEEFRDRRMQKAEEQAAKIGTKLLFPLVLCIFPAFFVVAIGPAVIAIIRVFEKL